MDRCSRAGHARRSAVLFGPVLIAVGVLVTAGSPPSVSAAPSPTTTTTSVPLGQSNDPSVPPLQFSITCNNAGTVTTLTGTLSGSGELQYPDVAAGTTCTATPQFNPAFSDVSAKQFPTVTPDGISAIVYKEGVPAIVLSPVVGSPGRSTTVLGAGFPPNDQVTLTWSSGPDKPLVVTTDPSGELDVQMLVLPEDDLGVRELVVTGTGFPSIQAGYLVVPPTVEASGPTTQVAFRS